MPTMAVGFFCDDIRAEANGQHTVVGVYPDSLQVPGPGKFDTLWLYIRIHLDPAEERVPVTILMRDPHGKEQTISELSAQQIDQLWDSANNKGSPFAGVLTHYRFSNVLIQAPGAMLAIVRATTFGDLIAARFAFSFLQPPQADTPAPAT